MSKWVQLGKRIQGNGEKTITYGAAGNPNKIESRKRAIPHANGMGVWFHTTYFLIRPDGTEREYWKRCDAEKAAES